MSKAKELLDKIKHSKEYLAIMEGVEQEIAIHTITHSKPVLVFWISEKGIVHDAKSSHVENPPDGKTSIVLDKAYKGYLRGRAAFIGNILYIVVYSEEGGDLSRTQFYYLRRHYPKLLKFLKENKGVSEEDISKAVFITEEGQVINL